MDFLFHKVSEEDKVEIKNEAKNIMDKFSNKLSKVDEKLSEPFIERGEFEREEGEGKESNFDFRQRMFENASRKNKDFIIAEKKKW